MAPRLPIPRISLKRRPSSRNDSPGLSSVPASIEPIITLAAPAASAFTTSPEYLMPPSAMTGTSPAPATASTIALICGTPTPVTTRVVQIEPGPTPTFTASTPRSTSARAPAAVATLPPTSCASGNASRTHATVLSTPSECPCAESTTITSHPASSSARARQRLGVAPHGRGDAQAAVLVLVGVGILAALEDVLDGDETLENPVRVHHGELLDAVLGEDLLGLVERGADGRRDQAVLRHRVADHPRLAALHAVHLRDLAVDRHVLVDHADPPLARDRNRHLRLGDGVHRRRHERDVERDAAGEAGARVDAPRVHARVPRNQENVVEGEGGAGAEGSHGESYWAGGVSSTFSGGFFDASSTAAFPAAATFSRNFPAFPTASIVPRMMFR